MNEEIKIFQFEDSDGNKVAPLVPEKAVVDKDGVRLSEKLEALNVNTIKEQINTAKEKAIEEVEASSENLTKNVGLDEYETFSEAKEYPAGYTLLKDGLLYTFITDHAAGAWNPDEVEETDITKIAKAEYIELSSDLVNINIDDQHFEYGSIYDNGQTSDDTNVIRSKGFLKLSDKYTYDFNNLYDNQYKILGIVKYDNELNFVSRDSIGKLNVFKPNNDYYYKFLVQKNDNSTINIDDVNFVISGHFLDLKNKQELIENYLGAQKINIDEFESGSIDVSGNNYVSSKACRSKKYYNVVKDAYYTINTEEADVTSIIILMYNDDFSKIDRKGYTVGAVFQSTGTRIKIVYNKNTDIDAASVKPSTISPIDVSNLKEKNDVLFYIPYQVSNMWEQGNISSDGGNYNSENCCRTINKTKIKPNKYYTLDINSDEYNVLWVTWLNGKISQRASFINPNTPYYVTGDEFKLVITRRDSNNFTPSDLGNISISVVEFINEDVLNNAIDRTSFINKKDVPRLASSYLVIDNVSSLINSLKVTKEAANYLVDFYPENSKMCHYPNVLIDNGICYCVIISNTISDVENLDQEDFVLCVCSMDDIISKNQEAIKYYTILNNSNPNITINDVLIKRYSSCIPKIVSNNKLRMTCVGESNGKSIVFCVDFDINSHTTNYAVCKLSHNDEDIDFSLENFNKYVNRDKTNYGGLSQFLDEPTFYNGYYYCCCADTESSNNKTNGGSILRTTDYITYEYVDAINIKGWKSTWVEISSVTKNGNIYMELRPELGGQNLLILKYNIESRQFTDSLLLRDATPLDGASYVSKPLLFIYDDKIYSIHSIGSRSNSQLLFIDEDNFINSKELYQVLNMSFNNHSIIIHDNKIYCFATYSQNTMRPMVAVCKLQLSYYDNNECINKLSDILGIG